LGRRNGFDDKRNGWVITDRCRPQFEFLSKVIIHNVGKRIIQESLILSQEKLQFNDEKKKR